MPCDGHSFNTKSSKINVSTIAGHWNPIEHWFIFYIKNYNSCAEKATREGTKNTISFVKMTGYNRYRLKEKRFPLCQKKNKCPLCSAPPLNLEHKKIYVCSRMKNQQSTFYTYIQNFKEVKTSYTQTILDSLKLSCHLNLRRIKLMQYYLGYLMWKYMIKIIINHIEM